MEGLALADVALLVAWPATAQVATVPVGLMQSIDETRDVMLAVDGRDGDQEPLKYGPCSERYRELRAPARTRDPAASRYEDEHDGDELVVYEHRERRPKLRERRAAASFLIDVLRNSGERWSIACRRAGPVRLTSAPTSSARGRAGHGSAKRQRFIDSAATNAVRRNRWVPGRATAGTASCSATRRRRGHVHPCAENWPKLGQQLPTEAIVSAWCCYFWADCSGRSPQSDELNAPPSEQPGDGGVVRNRITDGVCREPVPRCVDSGRCTVRRR